MRGGLPRYGRIVAAKDLRTDRAFELDGYWWVPDETERRAGHLSFNPNTGARLVLLDWFPGGTPFGEGSAGLLTLEPPERVAVVHGETVAGVRCTLFDVVCESWESSLAHSVERWSSDRLLHGLHVMSPDEVQFDLATAELRGLEPWLTQSTPAAGGLVSGLSGLEERDQVTVMLEGASLILLVAPEETVRRGERTRSRRALARFELDPPIALSEFREKYLGPLEDLLVLATREPVGVEHLSFFLSRSPPRAPGPPFPASKVLAGHRPEVKVVERVRSEWPSLRRGAYERMLFGVATLHEDPSAFVRRWFENRARLAEAGDLLIATLDGPKLYLENRLLNYLAFAEAYHRIEHDCQPLPEAVHERLVARMLDALDTDEQRDVYRNRLRYANSLSQRWRVEALVVRAAATVPRLEPLATRLSRGLVHTRNYITHWGDPTKHVLKDEELFDAVRQLVLVLQVNLMLDLGLSGEVVAACVEGSYNGDRVLPPVG